MSFQQIATGGWLEGMTIDRDTVWVSDVVDGGIRRIEHRGVSGVWRESDRWIGGILLNHDGKVLSSGCGGIKWFDPCSDSSGILIDSADGQKLSGANEMAPDDHGGIVFGTVDIAAFDRGTAPGPSSLYHLSADRRLTLLDEGLTFSNGLAFSADRRHLYHCESFVGVYAYEWSGPTRLRGRRLLLEKTDCDGLKVDVDGNLWATGFRSAELTLVSPAGGQVGTYTLPAQAATNLWFAGADDRDLYVTTVAPVPVASPNEIRAPTEKKSVLYRGRAPVAGLRIPRPRFNL